MHNPNATSRRNILKMLSAAPMLPLTTGFAGSALLAGCGGGDDARLIGVTFSSMAAPTLANPAAMATTTVGSVMSASFMQPPPPGQRLGWMKNLCLPIG